MYRIETNDLEDIYLLEIYKMDDYFFNLLFMIMVIIIFLCGFNY
jgi:hypothetical protein